MLTFTETARALAREKKKPVYLEMAPIINECCFAMRESPSVRFGEPKDKSLYQLASIEGLSVYVPKELPTIPLKINVRNILGWKTLFVEGWKLA